MPTYLHVLTVQVLSASTQPPEMLSYLMGARVVDVEHLGDPVELTVEEVDALTRKKAIA